MKKILVTTDFSANSKAGLRFAIQLASQSKYELTFFHVYNFMKPTSWNDKKFAVYENMEIEKVQDNLNHFVDSVYKNLNISQGSKKCVIKKSDNTGGGIREYASENKFSFICLSTKGAGKLTKIFGTNTSSLINFSDVPVIAVPANYRTVKITNILYASDFSNLEKEIKQVVEFTKPLKAIVKLLHFTSPSDILNDSKIIETVIKKFSKYDVKLYLENSNFIEDFISNIESAIKKSKPSMLVMFTEQNRTFFERLFMSGKSAEYSFNLKVPLMVFSK